MNRVRLVLATVAALAALSVPFVPSSRLAVDPTALVSLVGVGALGLGTLLWLQQGLADESRAVDLERVATPADDAPHRGRTRVGWRVDTAIQATPGELPVSPFRLRRELRRTLETTLVERGDLSKARARTLRETGAWTDDPRAATFLGGTDRRPWSLRVRDWVTGDGFSNNLRAATEEIDRIATVLDRSPDPVVAFDRAWDATAVREPNQSLDLRRIEGPPADGISRTAARRHDDAPEADAHPSTRASSDYRPANGSPPSDRADDGSTTEASR